MKSRWKFITISLVLGFLFLGFGLWSSSLNIIKSQGKYGAVTTDVKVPWTFDVARRNNILLLDIKSSFFSPKIWQIVADDYFQELTINGKIVPTGHISTQSKRDYTNGFIIDLSEYLVTGNNNVQLRFDNQRYKGKIDIHPVYGFWRLAIIFIGLSCFALSMSSLFRLRGYQTAILILALLPLMNYWMATPWTHRAHDVAGDTGHFGYVAFIANKDTLPAPNQGWTFYHPPTYYLSGAVVMKWAQYVGASPTQSLQALSLIYWILFLAAGMGTMRLYLQKRDLSLIIASLSLALWPSGIIHSPAIGNDSAFFATAAISCWFLVMWWFSNKRAHLFGMAIFTALCLLVKSNGIVIAAVCALLLSIRFLVIRREKKLRSFNDGLIFSVFALFGFAASFAVRIYYYSKGQISSWLVSNASQLTDALRVPVDLKAFLPLDIPTYLTNPFIDTWNDAFGRNNFWNLLLRTSLTGEFHFPLQLHAWIGYLWGALSLFLFFSGIFAIRKLSSQTRHHIYKYLPLYSLILLWTLSLISLRIKLPFGCSNDFRYILPILIPLLILWSAGSKMQKWCLVLISVGSAVFFTAF